MKLGRLRSSRHRDHTEFDQTRRWRYLAHRHGNNLLGVLMVMVMLCGAALSVLAS